MLYNFMYILHFNRLVYGNFELDGYLLSGTENNESECFRRVIYSYMKVF